MKTLKQILGDLGGYNPKPEGEQNFVKKHVVNKKEDMNGNGDDVFQATNVKTTDRHGERHGYTDEDDDKIHEEAEVVQEVSADLLKRYVTKATNDLRKRVASGESSKPKTTDRVKKLVWAQMMRKYKIIGEESEDLEEKKLTAAELKKREEIARAIERENPGIDMGKKMAIATAQAKKVAEAVSHEAKEVKKVAKGRGVPPTGAYDSVPLGLTVANEEFETDTTSLLEMFVALDEDEQHLFMEMLDMQENAQEAK